MVTMEITKEPTPDRVGRHRDDTRSAFALAEHLAACPGCSRLVTIDDLAAYLQTPVATLYKWSARRYPAYPHTSRLPNRQLVTRCSAVHAWLEERAA